MDIMAVTNLHVYIKKKKNRWVGGWMDPYSTLLRHWRFLDSSLKTNGFSGNINLHPRFKDKL